MMHDEKMRSSSFASFVSWAGVTGFVVGAVGCVGGDSTDNTGTTGDVDGGVVDGSTDMSDSGVTPATDASDAKGDAAPIACPGIGVRCGQTLGLDPTKLYQCKEGVVSGVARACSGACIVATNGTQDVCPCPEGDGRYCGARVGGDTNKLYDCKAGAISEAAECAPTCTTGSGPTADHCAPCTSGNGLYCGQNAGADPTTLYNCQNGVLTVQQKCAGTCVVEPPGTNDTCGPCPSGNGVYCGGPVGLDPNELYNCNGGVFTASQHCGSTCHVAPPGVNDYCEGSGLLCSNVQWWNSSITYGPYVDYGWWDTDLAIGAGTRVELRHDSKLFAEGVYAWGWMPQFVDQVTGLKFRFLHLQPTAQYTTSIGTVYPAGTVVGLSGGNTPATGYPTYSTGAHLCVQTLAAYRTTFPAGQDACH